MKIKKKTAMILSFTLGTFLLATTVLADVTTKSGYDQMKDALKATAEQCSEGFDSYTMDISSAIKDNGKTLETTNEVKKCDRTKNAIETTSSTTNSNGKKTNYQSYADKTTSIHVSDDDPAYYVTEYTEERNNQFSNPFKEKGAEDIEKIVDAVIGDLKDHVVVTENTDGSKGVTGSLNEVQIPALVNAVASFEIKQESNGNRDNFPCLTEDVFVKEVKGSATIDKDGVLESILGTAVLSGKDAQGETHEISLEALFKLSDINSTTVTKPDLTGKKVVKETAESDGSEISNPEKFVGNFKNDIVTEQNGKFIKLGERYLTITQADNTTVKGRYYEEYKSGYENYADSKRDFEFSAQKEGKGHSDFNFTSESGDKGTIYLDGHGGKIYFNIDNLSSREFDSEFSPDLE